MVGGKARVQTGPCLQTPGPSLLTVWEATESLALKLTAVFTPSYGGSFDSEPKLLMSLMRSGIHKTF